MNVIQSAMNIYDTKSVKCVTCGKFIGEIDYDASLTLPKCGLCANLKPRENDVIFHTVRGSNKTK